MARQTSSTKAEPKKAKRSFRKAKSIIGKIAKTTKKKVSEKATTVKAKTKAATGSKRKLNSNNLYDRIQQKAFDLFEQRGYSHGNDVFDWSIAEEFVRLEAEAAKSKKKKTKLSQSELMKRTEQKAYELFERKGFAHGYDVNDWAIAQQLVTLENV